MRDAVRPLVLVLWLALNAAAAPDEDITFKTGVSLARVDVQVVDPQNRAITGLEAGDFILREGGEPRDIKNFLAEDMPVDVLLLIDVSGSMQTHVQTIADAAHQALNVLAEGDRIAIMVFDRSTRIRLPFNANRRQVLQALDAVVSQEGFNGGTDITRAFYDASRFVARDARRDARRAIIILTDDQTERDSDEDGVTSALTRADVIASALLAPDAMGVGGMGRGGGVGTGGGWPGSSGGGVPDIIFGRRGPWGSRTPYPGGGSVGRTHSAGTAEIARRTGGDSMSVDDASSLEMTLTRIRQRYALHYNADELVNASGRDDMEVDLTATAKRRHPGAELRYRRVFMNSDGDVRGTEIRTASRTTRTTPPPVTADPELTSGESPRMKRRPAVSEPDRSRSSGPAISAPEPGAQPQGGWRRSDEPAPEPVPNKSAEPEKAKEAKPQEAQQRQGGWRRVQPGEQP